MNNAKLETRKLLTISNIEDLHYPPRSEIREAEVFQDGARWVYGEELAGFLHPFSCFLYKDAARRAGAREADGCKLFGSHGFKTHTSLLSLSPSKSGTLPHLLFFIGVTWVTEGAVGLCLLMVLTPEEPPHSAEGQAGCSSTPEALQIY